MEGLGLEARRSSSSAESFFRSSGLLMLSSRSNSVLPRALCKGHGVGIKQVREAARRKGASRKQNC